MEAIDLEDIDLVEPSFIKDEFMDPSLARG